MRIGYACLTSGVTGTAIKGCRAKNADAGRLYEITENNLLSLEHMLYYNIENNIRLFRISSDLIPFGSSPVNTIIWWNVFEKQFEKLAEIIERYHIRASMHPGQYTVLNSPNEDVVKRAIADLEYHARVLEALKTDFSHKIILHIGGIYKDKKEAAERFMLNYDKLCNRIKQRLVIENDDKSYNIMDVLTIGRNCGIPVVFDNLHHKVNPPDILTDEIGWINKCKVTWRKEDGCQKIHYSQQDEGRKAGSHSQSIDVDKFIEFVLRLGRKDIDIMLEVKDKNLSVIKCIKKMQEFNLI